jgi:hypothetical protein
MPEHWTLEDSQAFVVAKAGLVSKGWIEEVEGGVKITESGYAKAYEIWTSFSDEERILLGAFAKAILANADRRK